jgi:hypothetical protein
MHQHIRPAHKSMQIASLTAQVEGYTPFVGIEIQEQPAFFRIYHAAWERAALARRITLRFFHFDDIRAEVCHQFRGIRSRHHRS